MKSLRSVFFVKGQPPLIVVLACGSLGLIGLSRFLQCSVSFFLPQPFFSGCGRVCYGRTSRRSHHHPFLPKQEPPRLNHPIPQITFHSFGVSALANPQKKLHYTAKNPPALP